MAVEAAVSTQYVPVTGAEKSSRNQSKGAIQYLRPTLSRNQLKSVLESLVMEEVSFGQGVLNFEKAFSDVTTLLLNHLKQKPEARDLLQELMANIHMNNPNAKASQPGNLGPESRGPNNL